MTDLKNQLLQQSNNGLDFFRIYFGSKLRKSSPTSFKNLKSPFYPDKNGSFSIYKDDEGMWRFKDFGNPDHYGDCFDFYALVYKGKVSGFTELLYEMKKVLEKGISDIADLFYMEEEIIESKVIKIEMHEIPFTEEAKQFWSEYGISEDILRANNVIQISGYTINRNDGTEKYIWQPNLSFAYNMIEYYKIYRPKANKEFKFTYVGKGKREHIFGRNFQLDNSVLFITGGEKDVMTLHSLGYQAICLASEVIPPSRSLLKELYYDDYSVIVLYDTDETGYVQAKKLADKHSWKTADLASIIDVEMNSIVKDVSDYIKHGLPIDRLKALLNQFSENTLGKESEENKQIEVYDIPIADKNNEDNTDTQNFIPPYVYENLPQSLKDVVCKFDEMRRDLILVGALGVLSNIIKVRGVYHHKIVYPNLFIFITGPASTGKGDLAWAIKLGASINKQFKENYEGAFKAYKEDQKNNNKPYRKRLFISGNSSHSALIQQLYFNEGEGIMIETEADTLNNALNSEWGDYSDTMRRVFEFETISRLRKNEEESIDIEKPRLSIVLTGTKDQLLKLIPTPENGLFSRFIFMEAPLDIDWRNPWASTEDYESYYTGLADKFLKYYKLTRREERRFTLTADQVKAFNELHKLKQSHDTTMFGLDIIASVRRMGAIHFRLAMLLSTIRALDTGSDTNNVICSDTDYKVSTLLIKWFSKHTTTIYNQLPKKSRVYPPTLKKEIMIFCDSLSNEFTSKDVIMLGEKMGIAKSTYEAYIRKLINIKRIERYKQGVYRKIIDND